MALAVFDHFKESCLLWQGKLLFKLLLLVLVKEIKAKACAAFAQLRPESRVAYKWIMSGTKSILQH